MQIENISEFGRSFSVVRVPYSMKLLKQELMTINVQMRIIREYNIEQIENMCFSDNIKKPVDIDNFDVIKPETTDSLLPTVTNYNDDSINFFYRPPILGEVP